MSVRAAVFASGSGTNLQALLDHEAMSQDYRIRLVVSDRAGAGALDRARTAERRAEVVEVIDGSGEDVAEKTLGLLEEEGIRAIFLAGYLRLVPTSVVEAFRRRILNIHPALLPSFGGKGMYGLRVHQEVLRAGSKVTGVTIHYVDEDYDTGTIFAQWPVPVHPQDTPKSLAARVLRVEHILYPLAADHLCRAVEEGREPPRFAPPGEQFHLTDEAPDEEISRQIRRAFQGGR
ncbi:MAG: phosphoribosylglycinamide formyltransferase [Gemmatimonadetes bacterium]|nr:phosphoribosylglycinamide formyltransferase [Gemmatimonadota bacterium]NIR78592.1 phosphoribosylglycinamide formyltransferase [Gemmatimonadota bacterium]NIT87208.1 phosphoribosylglycinamide formyltransferase [Gemmatimonadota bacterium]NIU31050.1 phosphoribosylglycinamide formyltransferase [Gemmatimonadota bacterium]NIU35794.1 phosphoribosylglycinamide formyltransferase [Gemmatimonadota bacterium]